MADIAAAGATQLRNIEVGTGRTVAEWAAAIGDAGLVKHGQILAWLKSEHGLTHGNANALAIAVRDQAAGGRADDDAWSTPSTPGRRQRCVRSTTRWCDVPATSGRTSRCR